MKKQLSKIGITLLTTLCSSTNGIGQAYEYQTEEAIPTGGGIFPDDQKTDYEKSLSRRGNGGGTFNDDMTFDGNVPIDGGLSIVVTTLFGYGVRSLRKRRQLNKNAINR